MGKWKDILLSVTGASEGAGSSKTWKLNLKEAAAYNATPNEHGDLGDVVTVVGGTGEWAGATGRLRVWGNLTVTESDVTYEGDVCVP